MFAGPWAADVASLLGIASDRVTIVDHEPVPVPAGKSYFPFGIGCSAAARADDAATMHEHVYEIKEALPWDGQVATEAARAAASGGCGGSPASTTRCQRASPPSPPPTPPPPLSMPPTPPP